MGVQTEMLLRAILNAKPALEELEVGPAICDGEDYSSGIDALEDILKTCSRSLRTIDFEAYSVLPQLSCLPIMPNLSSLSLTFHDFCYEHLCDTLASLTPLTGNASRLGQVEIATRCSSSWVFPPRKHFRVSFKAPPSSEKGAQPFEIRTAKENSLIACRHSNIRKIDSRTLRGRSTQ